MKRYMITGGLGFIGSNLIHYLFRQYPDCKILNVDKEAYCSNHENLKGIIGKYDYTFSKTDIADPYIATLILEFKPDVIINAAAQTHVDRSIRNPKEFIDTDINGVFNLVFHSMKLGVERFIHFSTDEVFGPILKGEYKETDKLNPTSPYAASKAAGDLLLLSYIKTYGFPAILVRPCNNYGPRQYLEKLIPMVITQLLQDKKVILHGEGKEIREWIYVEDCCKAVDNIIQNGTIGEIYNIGSGERINNVTVIKKIINTLFGRVHDLDTFIKRVQNRPGNDKRYSINSSKVKNECGEYLTTRFDLGCKVTTDWYIKNKSWWSNLNVDLSSNIYENSLYLR